MTQQYLSPAYVDEFIQWLVASNKKLPRASSSKTKLPCTYCGATESTTWRPGPCGPGSLCNKCGVMYMDSGKRNRQIDLIMSKGTAMWVRKDQSCWLWKEEKEAPCTDPRVSAWLTREKIRNRLTRELNPQPLKRQRVWVSYVSFGVVPLFQYQSLLAMPRHPQQHRHTR